MRAYTRTYTYDKLANVEQVSHAATGSNYNRNFSYNAGHNTLDEITSGGSTLQAFTYDNSGNQITSGTTRKTIWNAGNMLKVYFNQSGTSEPTTYQSK